MRGGELHRIAAAMLAATALAACGGEEPTRTPSGPPMSARPAGGKDRVNQAPVIETLELRPARPRAAEPVRAVVRAQDPDHDPVHLEFRWEHNGRPVEASGPEFPGNRSRRGDAVRVTVVAGDGEAKGEPSSAEVRIGNQGPALRSVVLRPRLNVVAGIPISAGVEADDPDGDHLRFDYVWYVNDREAARGQATFSTAGLRRGDSVFVEVVVSDGSEDSRPVRSAPLELTNAAPVIRSAPQGIGPGGGFRYAVQAEDPDGDRPLRFRLLEGPRGMALDPATGVLVWQPASHQTGRHTVELAVEDPHGGGTAQRFELVVQAPEPTTAAPPAALRD